MASKVVTCKLELDADATRIAEAVAAMLSAQGHPSEIDAIVSNAVRIAFGERVAELTKDAAPRKEQRPSTGSYGMH